MLRTLALSGCIASAHGLTLGGAAPAHVVSHVPCTRSPAPLLAAVDDKAEVTEYFNNEGFSRWNRIYSEDGEVRRARAPREAITPTEPFHACAHTLSHRRAHPARTLLATPSLAGARAGSEESAAEQQHQI